MRNYICKYKTPEGFDDLVMCGDDEALTGLWFEGSRDDWRKAPRLPSGSASFSGFLISDLFVVCVSPMWVFGIVPAFLKKVEPDGGIIINIDEQRKRLDGRDVMVL